MFRSQDRPSPSRVRSLARISILASATWLAHASSGRAQDCRLALVLALDVSGSVSAAEDRLQREGLAAALLAPEVRRAFLTGGAVAVYVFEWAGASSQAPLLPGWVVVRDDADLIDIAGVIRQDRTTGFRATEALTDGTAVGSALVHAAAALSSGPECRARTVDVSGDGISSHGIEPRTVIDTLYDGITVNALIINKSFDDPMLEIRHGGDQQLVTWFEEAVVHGPGSFHVLTDSYDDYEQAMTTKLLREVQPTLMSGSPNTLNGG